MDHAIIPTSMVKEEQTTIEDFNAYVANNAGSEVDSNASLTVSSEASICGVSIPCFGDCSPSAKQHKGDAKSQEKQAGAKAKPSNASSKVVDGVGWVEGRGPARSSAQANGVAITEWVDGVGWVWKSRIRKGGPLMFRGVDLLT